LIEPDNSDTEYSATLEGDSESKNEVMRHL
jgi:hypothetical protein